MTSPSTAAFQDIISTVKRRAPNSQVSLSEAIVQGDAAHVSIINALTRIMNFNSNNPDNLIDVVIVSRGGGSIEDLWCFNNEDLAREIFSYPKFCLYFLILYLRYFLQLAFLFLLETCC